MITVHDGIPAAEACLGAEIWLPATLREHLAKRVVTQESADFTHHRCSRAGPEVIENWSSIGVFSGVPPGGGVMLLAIKEVSKWLPDEHRTDRTT